MTCQMPKAMATSKRQAFLIRRSAWTDVFVVFHSDRIYRQVDRVGHETFETIMEGHENLATLCGLGFDHSFVDRQRVIY